MKRAKQTKAKQAKAKDAKIVKEELPALPDAKGQQETAALKREAKPADEPKQEAPARKGLLKRWFHKKQDATAAAEEIERKGFKKPKKRHKLERRSLEQYLEKAGFSITAERVKRVTYYTVFAFFALTTILVLALAATHGAQALDVLFFIGALWTVLFAGMLLLVHMAIYFFLDYRIYQRTKEVEEVLPDFLQLASSNIAAGMPIDRALWYSIRPQFGVLAKEMEEVAKATIAGEDLEQSLMRFADKYDSQLLRRSVNILIEGMHSGGEMADLLNKIALNIDELKIMRKEMAANVTTYAIFITFASVVIAPFLFALATELLTIIVNITGSLDLSSSSFLTLKAADVSVIGNFQLFSILMLIVSTIFSACIVSIIKKGRAVEGVKTIPVFVLAALGIYYLGLRVLMALFSNLI